MYRKNPSESNTVQSGGLRTKGITKQPQENAPLVTVVTVVRNAEKTLEKTIKSVINQTYKNIEYIIIDGASTDNTIETIKKYEDRIDYWISEPDEGIYYAMNKGIEKSAGELIGIINSDDWYEPDTVNIVIDKYRGEQKAGIYHGSMRRIINNSHGFLLKNKSIKLLTREMIIHHPTCFVHRLVYEKIGVFNTNYKIAGDYDLLLRAYLAFVPFICINAVLANMSIGGISSINYIDGWKEEKIALVAQGYSRLYAQIFFYYKILKRMVLDNIKGTPPCFLEGKIPVKIRFTNFASIPVDYFLFPIRKVFEANNSYYKIVKYSKPHIHFFSVFGSRKKIKKSKARYKVFYTGENVNNNTVFGKFRQYKGNCLDEVDLSLAMGFDFIQNDRYMRFPLWLLYYFHPYNSKDEIKEKLDAFNQKYKKNKFCALIARHDRNQVRAKIHQAVSRFGTIDCPGMFLHNDNSLWNIYSDDKDRYLQQYKFSICPENSREAGYVTEKLFQSLHAGCIPVYSGWSKDPEPGVLNPDRILWFDPDSDNEDLLKQIKELFISEKCYASFMQPAVFLDSAVDIIDNYLKQYCERLENIAYNVLEGGLITVDSKRGNKCI